MKMIENPDLRRSASDSFSIGFHAKTSCADTGSSVTTRSGLATSARARGVPNWSGRGDDPPNWTTNCGSRRQARICVQRIPVMG
jgi:hypothetical protein